MFRFFRSIRQQLLAENKTVRYLKYAVGEVLLIVVGILIALQIGEWNQERRDRNEETYILNRILDELEANIKEINRYSEGPKRRREAMDRLAAGFAGNPITDNVSFLNDVSRVSIFGWAVPVLGRNTFEELVNAGKLGLIRGDELRDAINGYYDFVEGLELRIEKRTTGYSQIAYKLVPRPVTIENVVKEDLTEEEYTQLVEAVLKSDLKDYIVPAQNRNNLIETTWQRIQEAANDLIAKIETYLAD